MRQLLREPLVHFLLLGLALFLFDGWRGGGAGSSRIVITSGQIQHIAAGFAKARQRPPSEEELKGLLDEQVKDEMATREAIARGLDRDDVIIRRRLRQKLEFLVEDGADQAPPTDAEVKAWVEAHPDTFRVEPQVALRQVFVSRERRGAKPADEAARLLARLRSAGPDADVTRLGDPTSLPPELPLGSLREVKYTFGDDFALAVEPFAPGEWHGPVESTYGLHLVLVRERVGGGSPDLAAIRPKVEREIVVERRARELDAMYRRLLEKYTVVLEKPAAAAEKPTAGGSRPAASAQVGR